MAKPLRILFFLFFLITINARAAIPDSLQKILDTAKTDEGRANIFFKASSNFQLRNPALASEYAVKGQEISKRIHFSSGIAKGYKIIGEGYRMAGKYDLAMKNYLMAVNIDDSAKNEKNLGGDYASLGKLLNTEGNYGKALKYHAKANDAFTISRDTIGLINNFITISNVYTNIGHYDTSIIFLKQALELNNKLNTPNLFQKNNILSSLGATYLYLGNNKEAINYTLESMEYYKATGDSGFLGNSYLVLSESEFGLKEYDIAKKYAFAALNIFRKLNIKDNFRNAYEILARIYTEKKDYKQASIWYKNLVSLNDSLFNEQSTKQISEMETKYRSAEKDKALIQQKAQLDRQKLISYGSIGFIVLILLVSLFQFMSYRKINKLSKELSAQKEELEELNGVKNKLFSAISHDLRSPLGRVTNMLYMINEGEMTEEKLKSRSMDFLNAMRQTMQMLDNLLYWATGQMKGLTLQKVPLNIWDIVHENMDLMNGEAETKKIILSEEIDRNTIANADTNMIRLVMRNLISNAIKFTPEHGQVTIASRQENNQIFLNVKDSGIGIDAQTIQAIFSNKQVKSRGGTKAEKGFGIGLQLCKDFIEMNGGVLTIKSVLGEGSTFEFSLPAC